MASDRPDSEEAIIGAYFAPLAAGYPGAFGLKDDCAAITPEPGCDLVVTTDAVIEGVHFFPGEGANEIAWKALAVNVSDLVAKGATPIAYVMSIALPRGAGARWLEAFAKGLRARSRDVRLPLDRRRHRPHAGSAQRLDHGVRSACPRAGWCAARRRVPATWSTCPAPSATPRSASTCGATRRWRRAAASTPPRALASTRGSRTAAADQSWRPSCATWPRRRWMSPTGS